MVCLRLLRPGSKDLGNGKRSLGEAAAKRKYRIASKFIAAGYFRRPWDRAGKVGRPAILPGVIEPRYGVHRRMIFQPLAFSGFDRTALALGKSAVRLRDRPHVSRP